MSNTGSKGIDCRQTGTALIFEAFLTASGAPYSGGTTTVEIYEVQSIPTLNAYDFSSNTFKTPSTTLTTQTEAMTQIACNNSSVNTGIWLYALTTLTGFTNGARYMYLVRNSGADTPSQCREFIYGQAEGDLNVVASSTTGKGYVGVDLEMMLGNASSVAVDGNGWLKVDVVDWLGSVVNALVSGRVDSITNSHSGTAQGGTASTITLDTGASSVTSQHQDSICFITGGTGAGQSRSIQNYNGSTRVATVFPNWATNPDSTSTFTIVPFGQVDIGNWYNETVPAPNVTGVPVVDVTDINGSPVSTSTAQLGVNVVSGGSSGPSAAAIAAAVWQDTTSTDFMTAGSPGYAIANGVPVSGTPAVNLTKIAGTMVSTTSAQLGVNVVQYNGQAAATGGDNLPKVSLFGIMGALLSGTSANLAASFSTMFNVASSVFTTASANQTGDTYARLGAPAGASTAADIAAISAKTTNLPASPASTTNITGGTITTVSGNVNGSVGSVTGSVGSVTGNLGGNVAGSVGSCPDTSGTTTLLGRLTSSRAGYLDNLNVGGNVASHADIAAINQSASRTLVVATVGQYAPGESYSIDVRTYSTSTGLAVAADSTPTLMATGAVSGSLAANLSGPTNPDTGHYIFTYAVPSSPTLEQITFAASATISSVTYKLSAYAQTVDAASAVWSSTQASQLTAIYNKLPTNNIADETLVIAATNSIIAAVGTPFQASSDFNTAQKASLNAATPIVTAGTVTDKTGYSLTAAYDAAKTAAQVGNQMDLVNAPNATALMAIETSVWSGTQASQLTAIYNKLPSNNIADETLVISAANSILTAVGTPFQASSDFNTAQKASLNAATPTVTAGTVTDKTGYSLTTAYDTAKTAAQVGSQMDLVNAPNATAMAAIGTSVWSSTTRTLSAFSFTVASNLTQILGTAFTESTGGWIASAFKKFFNIGVPTSTMNEITLVDTTTTVTDAVTVTGTPAVNVTEISGAAVSTTVAQIGVNVVSGGGGNGGSGPTAAEIATAILTDTTSGDLTVAGSPGAAIMTIAAKLPANTIADETLVISAANSILTAVGSPFQASSDFNSSQKASLNAATPIVTAGTVTDKAGYALTTAYDAAKTAAQAGNQMDLVNAPNATALTAIGTSVWSSTTRTLSAFSFTVASNLTQILGTAFTESTGGWIAGAFKKFFNIASPTSTMNEITLVDTVTTYTGNTPQSGDAFARIGANGIALTAIPDTSGTTTLLGRLTPSRAGYLDNLNIAGNVASQADISAINQSASRTLVVATVGQYAAGESYTIDVRTYAISTGVAIDADMTPTLTATGSVSGSLAVNLSGPSHPDTGHYVFTYAVPSSPISEQVTFAATAVISGVTYHLSAYSQTVDSVTTGFTSTQASQLATIYNKLPANNIADETVVMSAANTILAAVGSPFQASSDFNALQKSSLNAATPASVLGAVGSVIGNVGGNVVGSVGSVVANVNTNPNSTETAIAAKTANLPSDPASQAAIIGAIPTPQVIRQEMDTNSTKLAAAATGAALASAESVIIASIGSPLQAVAYEVSPTAMAIRQELDANSTKLAAAATAAALSAAETSILSAIGTTLPASGYSDPPTATEIAAATASVLFVDGATNQLKVNPDHSVMAIGDAISAGNYIAVPAAVALASQNPTIITCLRGDTLRVGLPQMGNVSGRTKLVMTAKANINDTDAQAVFQIVEDVGLVCLKGSSVVTASAASITVTDPIMGSVDLEIDASVTAELAVIDLVWDIQVYLPTGIVTPMIGTISVVADVTQAVT